MVFMSLSQTSLREIKPKERILTQMERKLPFTWVGLFNIEEKIKINNRGKRDALYS